MSSKIGMEFSVFLGMSVAIARCFGRGLSLLSDTDLCREVSRFLNVKRIAVDLKYSVFSHDGCWS